MVQLLGLQGFWQHQVLREVSGLGSRKYSALEGYGNPYWPIRPSILAWRTPFPDREAWQATVYRVAKSRTLLKQSYVHRSKTFFFACGSSGPVRVEHKGGTAAWLAGILAVPSCRDMDCLRCRSYGPIRVFFHASCSWQSEGLFSQFLSVALQVQALRGLPCLRSFSVVWCVRHIEGAPGLGPTL